MNYRKTFENVIIDPFSKSPAEPFHDDNEKKFIFPSRWNVYLALRYLQDELK